MTGQKNRLPRSGRGDGNEEFPEEGTDVADPRSMAASASSHSDSDDIDSTAVTFGTPPPSKPAVRKGSKTVLDPPRPEPRGAAPRPQGPRGFGPSARAQHGQSPPQELVVTAPAIVAPPRGTEFDSDGPTRTFEAPPSGPPHAPHPAAEPRAPTGASRSALAQGVGTGPRPMTARLSAVPTRAKGTKEDPFALIGTALERRFRIDRLVAEGGYGAVYHGTHLTLERPIALKVLKTPPGLEGDARREFMDKFVSEAKVIARLNHSAIVQVLDTDVSVMPTGEPAPWMALEWLEGRTLEELQRDRRGFRYGAPDAVRIMRPVLEALAFAHSRGVAHRDVKPGNIIVVPEGASAQVKLLDFGIAKVMQPNEESATSVTRNALVNYSPHYAAPEQVAGMRSGPWSDVHAVALVLTELLTGQSAYRGNDLSELMSVALNPARPTPRALGFDVGPIELVLEKAMAFKAADRYQNMREMILAIDAVVSPVETTGIIASGLLRVPDLGVPSAPFTPPAASVAPPPGYAAPYGAPSSAFPVVQPAPFPVAAQGFTHQPTAMMPSTPTRRAPSRGPSIFLWILAGLGVMVLSAGVVALFTH